MLLTGPRKGDQEGIGSAEYGLIRYDAPKAQAGLGA